MRLVERSSDAEAGAFFRFFLLLRAAQHIPLHVLLVLNQFN